jgi:DNA-binding HxlR family transcriptional regulator
MAIPKPGKPVRGSQSGAPLMAVFDLLGRRWAMGIIWQLSRGPATFRALQGACETISPSILNIRLKDLREAQLIERTIDGYRLTELGAELHRLLLPFGEWSIKWATHIAPDDIERWESCRSMKK